MIVWIVAGVLSWGTFFALVWVVALRTFDIDTLGFLLLALSCFLIGAFSGFAESQARQEIAKLRQHGVSMRGPSIVYTGLLEHGTDNANGTSPVADS